MDKKRLQMKEYYQSVGLDVHELIRRLRTILSVDKDVELADILGFDNRNQITMFKLRNQITATGWIRILQLLNRPEYRFINLNELFHGLTKANLKSIKGGKNGEL